MANLSISISNRINTFGPAETSKWGTMLWSATGAGMWGEGVNHLLFIVGKLSAETVTVSEVFEFSVRFGMSLAESITVLSENEDLILTDGTGYSYIFPSNTSDGAEQDTPVYTSGAAASGTWTSGTVTSTSWS